jgi:hypothetical protein
MTSTGWPDEFEKCSPNHILSKLMHELDRKIKWPKNVGYFSNFHLTAQSKQSPIGRTNLVTLAGGFPQSYVHMLGAVKTFLWCTT